MPSYSFAVYECGHESAGEETERDLADANAARTAAIEIARKIMARELLQGKICLSCWIVISNASGHNLMVVQFGEAVDIVDVPAHCRSLDGH